MSVRSIRCTGVAGTDLFVEVKSRKRYVRIDITPPLLSLPFSPTVWMGVPQARELAAVLSEFADDLERRLAEEKAGK